MNVGLNEQQLCPRCLVDLKSHLLALLPGRYYGE